MRCAFTYIVASRRNGTLYTGVTSNLEARIWQHKAGVFAGFSRKYGCTDLVWFEIHDVMEAAIKREKQIKRWRRRWKLALIEESNPHWIDLYDGLLSANGLDMEAIKTGRVQA